MSLVRKVSPATGGMDTPGVSSEDLGVSRQRSYFSPPPVRRMCLVLVNLTGRNTTRDTFTLDFPPEENKVEVLGVTYEDLLASGT